MEILRNVIRPELYAGLHKDDRVRFKREYHKSYLYVVLNTVCSIYNVSAENVLGKSRERIFTYPRFTTIKILMDSKLYTLKQLGTIFSNRDHSTIIHNLNVFNDIHDTDKDFRSKYERAMNILRK